jgi:hypothetical protein
VVARAGRGVVFAAVAGAGEDGGEGWHGGVSFKYLYHFNEFQAVS